VAKERSESAYEIAKKSRETERESIVLKAHQCYYNVLSREGQLELAALTLEKDELNLKIARLSYEVGLISRQQLIGAETQLAATRAALAAVESELDKAYKALNLLVGLPEDTRPRLVDTVAFTPFEGELKIQQSLVLDESPMVLAAVENARLTEELDGWDEDISSEDIEIAKRQAAMTKDSAREAVRNLYYAVKDMEENYEAARESVSLAEENFRVANLKFELGMATKSDIIEAEWQLADARQRLLSLTLDHAYYKAALEKPWAYLGAAGSTGS